MQTFMPVGYKDNPSKSFQEAADCLDWQFGHNRLNNQVNEVIVIEKTLLGRYEKGWINHPAVRMWKGYELSLLEYGETCLATWMKKKEREFDVREETFVNLQLEILNNLPGTYYCSGPHSTGSYKINHPWWLGDERFHSSHRAVLLGKDLEKGLNWYSQFGWEEEPAVRNEKGKWSYFWPV